MSKILRRALAVVLVVSLLLTSNIQAFAAAEEVYLSDLRIIYAEDYSEAKEILSNTDFKDYKILNENLNEGTKEIGVWLAYKTTTNIEDAITDLSVMQMNGGYQEGNYQKMIQESLAEYKEMAKQYETIIDYFNEAYDADHFLAKMAYRQLNLYTIKTLDLDEKYIPDFEGERLGDIFYDGIDSDDLAEIFMEGNTHVLDNVRSLLAMGVSYNEDGLTYMEKVAEAAAKMNDDPDAFEDDDEKDYDELAVFIVPAITAIQDMFEEFSDYEDELNFNDEEVTEQELKYAEHKTIANMMRGVDYLGGKTLYDFVLDYTVDKSDYSSLYPLIAALNEGQTVMTKMACFYNVVRYSMSDYPEEYMEGKMKELEDTYGENPFNVYEGVDRTVFKGTFALTTAASRADAYTERNTIADAYFGSALRIGVTSAEIALGAGGIGIMIWGAFERSAENAASEALKAKAVQDGEFIYNVDLQNAVGNAAKAKVDIIQDITCQKYASDLMTRYYPDAKVNLNTFKDQFNYLFARKDELLKKVDFDRTNWNYMVERVEEAKDAVVERHDQIVNEQVKDTLQRNASTGSMAFSSVLFIVGGVMLLVSASGLVYTVYSYYHPTYEDIPLSMVDMRETTNGDRYIKYEVVREAEEKKDGVYAAGDLNAFEAQRWNALYYTKSYEAGKPLLADEFVASTSNNKAKDGYTPVHRFGEEICYDLNKYNFSDKSPSIYLSVKQSKNDKSAVADVPEVVGSMFSGGLWLIAGSVGALFGIGGTLGTQALLKKKKSKSDDLDE